jgi:hypothetical protein
MLLADYPVFLFLHVIGMANLLTAVSLAGNWTHWWVVYKVALCNPRLGHTTMVGLLWTSDWPTAGTSTWQHTTLRRDRHPCLHWIQTCILSKRVVTDPCCRMHGHWGQLFWHLVDKYSLGLSFRAPLCDSLKCLFISCVQVFKFSVWKTD